MLNKIYQTVEKYKHDKDFIDLTDSNFARPDFYKVSYPIIKSATNKALSNRSYTPDARGDLHARESISEYYFNRRLSLSPDEILITASTSEAYNIIFQTFGELKNTGLIPNPTYPLFEYLFTLNKLDYKFYNLEITNNWRIDFKSIESQITSETKFLVAITPNNPTGSVIPQEDLYSLIQICQKHKIILIIDEVFIPYCDSSYSLPPKNEISTPIIILNGISKMFALPDFKLGWIAVYGNNTIKFIDELETTNDIYLSANTITQKLLPDLFLNIDAIQAPIKKLLTTNRKIINEFIKNNSKIVYSPQLEGGIHLFVQIKDNYNRWVNEEDFVLELLNKKKILVHPGFFYDHYDIKTFNFSLSYLTNIEIIKKGMVSIIEFIALAKYDGLNSTKV